MSETTQKTRYSDAELEEFRAIIVDKIEQAKAELKNYQDQLSNSSGNGTDDTASSYVTLEEGSATLEREHISQLAARQRKFIGNLDNALIRINNKTYGICRDSGTLIPKERLYAVPHATLSIESKNKPVRTEAN
jgi:RNA polymerase-binding protein DksA